MISKEWVKNELSLSDDCLTTTDRVMLNKVLQDLERLEHLEKENQELIKKADCCLWKDCNKISQENQELKDTNMKYAKLIENLLEKYEIEDLSELEIALDQYYHRYDNVQTRRVNDNE